ncbi:MAG TPA: GrpB family protein [Acetobacteraceae bacterium]|nr:GrpB family protein [Acetobacteraceae bacterium]
MPDQPIALVEHDPSWHDRFLAQQAVLARLLRPWLAAPPEHVGSTAVPGLRAKPIVDIIAPVHSLTAAQEAVPVLEQDGWLFWAGDPNRAYRLWFLRPTPAARTHHLQIMQHDHPELHNLLVFRDTLRDDPALRQAYAALKDRLAVQHHGDRNAYTDAKSDFVRSVLQAAGVAPSLRRPLA